MIRIHVVLPNLTINHQTRSARTHEYFNESSLHLYSYGIEMNELNI